MRKNDFDEIIKKQILNKYGESHFLWNEVYDKYYSQKDFDLFIDEIRLGFPDAYQKYAAGKGGELNSKTVNGQFIRQKWRMWHHLQDFVI